MQIGWGVPGLRFERGALTVGGRGAGWFKFGGVEFFKVQATNVLGERGAWNNKTVIYLGSAACAEFIADIFLCPLEATRIRCVSDPSFASGLVGGFMRLIKEEGPIKGFYSGAIFCHPIQIRASRR